MTANGIHRRLPVNLTPSLLRRFHKQVDRREPDECWPWLACFRNGYGAIKHEGKALSAHRLAYIIAYGEPDPTHLVRHRCDNRACCNPAHLIAGTYRDNVRDMVERGQFRSATGEDAYNAVLNEDLVRQIRRIRREQGWGAKRIGQALGVSEHACKSVIRGRTWRHVKDEDHTQ